MGRFNLGMLLMIGTAGVLFLFLKLGAGASYVHRSVENGTTVYTTSLLMVAVLGFGSLATLTCAWLMASGKAGWWRLTAALPAMMGVVFTLATYDALTSHVTIGNSVLVLPKVGLPRDHAQFKYENLNRVVWRTAPPTNEKEPLGTKLVVFEQDGTQTELPVGDLMKEAMPQFEELLEAHHVPLIDERDR
jgi:hypothetical protein